MKVVSYTRAVTNRPSMSESQTKSIEEQNLSIQNFVSMRGWKIEKWYSDTEKNKEQEEAFLKMKSDGIARKFDCVVIDSVYLCGKRSALALDLFYQVFLPAGIHFAVVEDEICSVEMGETEARSYLLKKREESRTCQTTACIMKNGEMRQYPKYGYCYKGSQMELEINGETACVVRKIFQLASEGYSGAEIVRVLNREKMIPPHIYNKGVLEREESSIERDGWKDTEVVKILTNRLYIGEWERTSDGKKVTVECPAIVETSIFQMVNEEYDKRRKARLPHCKETIYSGMVWDRCTGKCLRITMRGNQEERVFRMSIKESKNAGYRRAWISCAEVDRQFREQLRKECRKANVATEILASAKGIKEKEGKIILIRREAQNILIEMQEVLVHRNTNAGKNCSAEDRANTLIENEDFAETMPAEDINSIENNAVEEYENRFYELDQKMRECEERIADIEKAFSVKNPWIRLFADIDFEKELTRQSIRKFAERIECIGFENVTVIFKNQKWYRQLPTEWFYEEDV